MTDSNETVVSGWYPDPEGSEFKRYFGEGAWGLLVTGDASAFDSSAKRPASAGSYTNQDGETHYWNGTAWAAAPEGQTPFGHFQPDIQPMADVSLAEVKVRLIELGGAGPCR